MTRSPLFLAALASSAVPGLDPARVEGVRTRPGDRYEVAYVQDTQDRRWVIKAPLTSAAGAMLDDVTVLSTLLGRRLDVAIPMVRGQVVVPQGRAVVYLRVPGRPLDFRRLPAGPGLAADLGRTLGHIHNIELAVLEEAGRPSYDAETHRARRLSELDRAAATGHVPARLLARWERALEDVSHWRFAPTAVHGNFVGANVLASFEDEQDAATGRVRGVLAWEESRIGDPADDLAQLVRADSHAAIDAVLEAYAQSRVERPDPHLLTRARLASEMAVIGRLLAALSAGELGLVDRAAEELHHLDERTGAEDQRQAEAAAQQRAANAAERAAQQDEADRAVAAAAASRAHNSASTVWDATQPHDPFPVEDRSRPREAAPAPVEFEVPLEGEEDAVSDLHEGASDFVPVTPPRRAAHAEPTAERTAGDG